MAPKILVEPEEIKQEDSIEEEQFGTIR